MSAIVIVYHSGYGHTKKVAEAVAASSGGQLLAIDAEGNLPAGGWHQVARLGIEQQVQLIHARAQQEIAFAFTHAAAARSRRFEPEGGHHGC